MQENAQYFEKRFFINRSQIFIALLKFYADVLASKRGNCVWQLHNKNSIPANTKLKIKFLLLKEMRKGGLKWSRENC